MGWLYQHHPIDDPVVYLTAQFTHEGTRRTSRALAAARVGGTVYMAVRSTDRATGESYVLAAVILISDTRKHGFGYKDMDEGMGPSECACPQRIMRLLSPIAAMPNPGYAAAWRARVAAHHQAAADWRTKRVGLRPGCLVTLEHQVSFRDATTAGVFRLRFMQRRTPIFEPVDRPGFLCRLSGRSLAAAVINHPARRSGAGSPGGSMTRSGVENASEKKQPPEPDHEEDAGGREWLPHRRSPAQGCVAALPCLARPCPGESGCGAREGSSRRTEKMKPNHRSRSWPNSAASIRVAF